MRSKARQSALCARDEALYREAGHPHDRAGSQQPALDKPICADCRARSIHDSQDRKDRLDMSLYSRLTQAQRQCNVAISRTFGNHSQYLPLPWTKIARSTFKRRSICPAISRHLAGDRAKAFAALDAFDRLAEARMIDPSVQDGRSALFEPPRSALNIAVIDKDDDRALDASLHWHNAAYRISAQETCVDEDERGAHRVNQGARLLDGRHRENRFDTQVAPQDVRYGQPHKRVAVYYQRGGGSLHNNCRGASISDVRCAIGLIETIDAAKRLGLRKSWL